MKIKAIVPWYGGKRTLAPQIIDLLGKHSVYWEPFCGSMAVLLAKAPSQMETVNDLHGELINLARVIQDPKLGLQLYDKLNKTLFHEQFFHEAKSRWISRGEEPITESPDIPRAYDYFVASWFGMNGVSGTKRSSYQYAIRWCSGGGQGAMRWRSVKDSIPAWHKRLNLVVIMQRDAFDILAKIKDELCTAIYCDPPYFEKGSKYLHDFTELEHERLAKALGRFKKTIVVVSYYDHPLLQALYDGWYRTEFKAAQSLRNANQPNTRTISPKTEVLLVNQKSTTQLW